MKRPHYVAGAEAFQESFNKQWDRCQSPILK